MSLESNTAFLGVGGAAAGASLASAVASLAITAPPLFIPVGGAAIALLALKLAGVFNSPEKIILGSKDASVVEPSKPAGTG